MSLNSKKKKEKKTKTMKKKRKMVYHSLSPSFQPDLFTLVLLWLFEGENSQSFPSVVSVPIIVLQSFKLLPIHF